MEYKGYNGTIVAEQDRLIITHSGVVARAGGLTTGQPRVIPLPALSDVAFRDASRLTNGWLTLGVGGSAAARLTAGTAASNPEAVLFRHKDKETFRLLYDWLLAAVAHNRAHNVDASAVEVETAGPTRADRIEARVAPAEPNAEAATVETGTRKAQKAASTAAKQEQKAREAAAELANYGRQVAKEVFGNRTVRIYDKRYVRVAVMMFGSSAPFERLIAIDASADVSKKSGLGRGVGAVATMGVNLLGSNKRGDVYLTITTDVTTHVLHEDPPTAMGLKTVKRLEAAGRAVLQAGSPEPVAQERPSITLPQANVAPSTPSETSTAQKLRELADLRAEGLVSADEYEKLRARLLGLG